MRDSAGRVTLIVSVQYEVRGSPESLQIKSTFLCITSNVFCPFPDFPLFVQFFRCLVPLQQLSPLQYQAIWVGCTRPWTAPRQTGLLPCRCPPPRKALRRPLRGAVRHSLMIEAALAVGRLRGAGRQAVGTPLTTTGQLTGSATKAIPISSYIASVAVTLTLVNPCRSLLHLISWDYFSHIN